MKLFLNNKWIFLSLMFLTVSCNDNPLMIDVSDYDVSIDIKSFDKGLFESDTLNWEATYLQLKRQYPPFFETENDIHLWLERRNDPDLNRLYQEVSLNNMFTDQLVQEIEHGLKHYYHYFPERNVSSIYSYISGLDIDYPVIYADSMLFVASDIYLGSSHELYKGIQKYRSKQFDGKYLIRDVFKEISRYHIPFDNQNKTLLNRMLYEGKRMYFLDAMLPSVADSLKIGFTSKEWDWAVKNEAFIWSYLVTNKMLFSTEQKVIARFIEPAPFTKFYSEIDQLTPGRLGVWMGWQMIRSFMRKHSDVELKELIGIVDAQELLNKSNYKPSK